MKRKDMKRHVHWLWSSRARYGSLGGFPKEGETECKIDPKEMAKLPMGFTKSRPERVTCPLCLASLHGEQGTTRLDLAPFDWSKLHKLDETEELAWKAAGNWQEFESFCWHTRPDDAEIFFY
jgi:hypothetical protein